MFYDISPGNCAPTTYFSIFKDEKCFLTLIISCRNSDNSLWILRDGGHTRAILACLHWLPMSLRITFRILLMTLRLRRVQATWWIVSFPQQHDLSFLISFPWLVKSGFCNLRPLESVSYFELPLKHHFNRKVHQPSCWILFLSPPLPDFISILVFLFVWLWFLWIQVLLFVVLNINCLNVFVYGMHCFFILTLLYVKHFVTPFWKVLNKLKLLLSQDDMVKLLVPQAAYFRTTGKRKKTIKTRRLTQRNLCENNKTNLLWIILRVFNV